uniref:protein spinster homolog 3-like n=1 Tax=Callithrix jacchus TaxID=9483 RepID=UPI0023DCFB92|nr:protein spinster homolog 3-like [Callithrix jacchus]
MESFWSPGMGRVDRFLQPQPRPMSAEVPCLSYSWSFVWLTLGVTAMAFVAGALGFWVPKFLLEVHVVHGLQLPCLQEPCSNPDSLIFGSLTIITGVIGVILGAEVAKRYKKVNPRAEPLICASSLLTAAPCLYLALVLAPTNLLVSYVSERLCEGEDSVGAEGSCFHRLTLGLAFMYVMLCLPSE